MERMPDPPPRKSFEIDEGKLRSAVEKHERWFDDWYSKDFAGKLFFWPILGLGYAALIAIGLALAVGLVMLIFVFPDFGIAIAIAIALMVIPGLLAGPASKRR